MPMEARQTLAAVASALALGLTVPAGAELDVMPTAKPKICVVTPDVQFGQGVNASTDPATPVTASLITYLSGPAADVVALRSRVPLQVSAEATQQGCSHIVDMTVTHRKAGKGMKKLLAVAPGLASAIPFAGGMAGFAASAAVSAAADGMAAAQTDDLEEDWVDAMKGMAQVSIKKGDLIVLKYQVHRPGSAETMAGNELEAKATTGGEDILSPLIEQSATEVLVAAMGDH